LLKIKHPRQMEDLSPVNVEAMRPFVLTDELGTLSYVLYRLALLLMTMSGVKSRFSNFRFLDPTSLKIV